jgi:hypothetical protein
MLKFNQDASLYGKVFAKKPSGNSSRANTPDEN